MKKIGLSVLVFTVMGLYAPAGNLEENCGCGLGSMIFEGNDSLVVQLLAVTTNGFFGNQTFGISSGTLGCDQPISLVSNERLNRFVADNMDNLAKDIAMGYGESIDTVAELMSVDAEKRNELFSAFQSNFGTIFSSSEVAHTDVVQNLVAIYQAI